MVLATDPSSKEATRMRDCNQGWFQQQFNFLRRQFLQDIIELHKVPSYRLDEAKKKQSQSAAGSKA